MQNHKIKPIISIIIPVFNEGRNIEILIEQIDEQIEKLRDNYFFEIIFVNDGSRDETYDVIVTIARMKKHIKLIDLSRNFGNQIAVTAGINESKGHAVITMDGDMQHPPSLIPELIAEWEKGYEIVETRRIQYRRPGFIRNMMASIYFNIMKLVSEIDISKDISDFRLMDRKVVEHFKRVTEKKRFVRGIINWMGFRKSFVDYQIKSRSNRDTSFSILELFRLATTGLISFSLFPLKLAFILGFIITIISSGLLIFMSYSYLFVSKEMFRPIAFFSVLNALMGGLILLCLGFISMYIGNIHEEVRNRPLYMIRERINFDGDNNERYHENKLN